MKSTSLLATLTLLFLTASAAPLAPREIDGPVYIPSGNRMVVTKAKRDLEDREVTYVEAGNRMVLTRDAEPIVTYVEAGNRMVLTRDAEPEVTYVEAGNRMVIAREAEAAE